MKYFCSINNCYLTKPQVKSSTELLHSYFGCSLLRSSLFRWCSKLLVFHCDWCIHTWWSKLHKCALHPSKMTVSHQHTSLHSWPPPYSTIFQDFTPYPPKMWSLHRCPVANENYYFRFIIIILTFNIKSCLPLNTKDMCPNICTSTHKIHAILIIFVPHKFSFFILWEKREVDLCTYIYIYIKPSDNTSIYKHVIHYECIPKQCTLVALFSYFVFHHCLKSSSWAIPILRQTLTTSKWSITWFFSILWCDNGAKWHNKYYSKHI